MRDQDTMEPFDTRLADLARAYTDAAGARPVDAVAIARIAMATSRTAGRWSGGLGAGSLGRRIGGGRLAAAGLAIVLVGVIGFAVVSPPSNSGVGPQPTASVSPAPSPRASAVGPVPEALRHSWQRPLPIAPGPAWATSFLSLTDGVLGIGPDQGAATSSSTVAAAGPDTLVVTGSPETAGCKVGDVGVYAWSLDGKDTYVTLTAIGPDDCTGREAALAGPWVRADLPQSGETAVLSPGLYATTRFDPFGDAPANSSLSYTVPGGWQVMDDQTTSFVLHHVPDASPTPAPEGFIFVIAQPRVAAPFAEGAACGPFGEAPGVGPSVDDIVAALVARPGVVSTPPKAVTISGRKATLLDLDIAPSWTGGCTAPEGPMLGIPLLKGVGGELGPSVGLVPDAPVRLILVEIADGHAMAIVVACAEPARPSRFDEQVAAAMPIIDSFELHRTTP